MPFVQALALAELPLNTKKTIKLDDTEILLVHTAGAGGVATIVGLEAKCPHAGAPLEQGALCAGKLVCPWHTGTFALPSGEWLQPPALRSLKTYAVQVEGDRILVDPKPLTSTTLSGRADETSPRDARHFVMIGAGAAAATAVCTLRQEGFTGRITLIDPAAHEPVDRTNLSKMALAGKKELKTLPLWTEDERQALRVEQIASRATDLDATLQTVTLADNTTLPFDAALVATGGEPVRLEIPGADLPHVHTLRHVADLEAILADLPGEAHAPAVLIGDSFIAFEAASALAMRGLKLTVVARAEAPFAKKWGEAPASALLDLHRQKGVTVLTGAEAASITLDAVTLKSGKRLPASLVITAIGVQPQTAFAGSLTLDGKGLVKVGPDLKAANAVWAAGDITIVDGVHIEHWRVAQQHGRAAARAMLGLAGENAAVPFFWTAHHGKRFGYAGHAERWDELVVDGDLPGLAFLAYYVQSGRVAAVMACGRDTALAALECRLAGPLTLETARAVAAASA